MPRINMTGQEGQRKLSWQEVQDLMMVTMFNSTPEEDNRIRQELKSLIEEFKENVCEIDKRNND